MGDSRDSTPPTCSKRAMAAETLEWEAYRQMTMGK